MTLLPLAMTVRPRRALLPLLDLGLAPATYLAARLLRFVRRMTLRRMPCCARMIEHVNIYPLIDHFYEPRFNLARLRHPLDAARDLPGVALDDQKALACLHALSRAVPALAAEMAAFDFGNDQFGPGDADMLHAFVRRQKPRLLIEIGCGWSSRVIARALDLNALSGLPRGRHVCIDPYPGRDLAALGAEVLQGPVEDCPPALFSALGEGDILFIDSSHMIRPQGDVLFEMQRLLPRLASGVVVHVHDIFTPCDYAGRLVREHRVFWNEQYLLEAFLAFNRDFEIVLPLNHLWRTYPGAVKAACPGFRRCPDAEPASFWMKRK